MKPAHRRRPGHGGRGLRRSVVRAVTLVAIGAFATVAAACGGSGGDAQSTAAQAGQGGQGMPTAMQVLTRVERGDVTRVVVAPARLESLDGEKMVVATVPAEDAGSVAAGQSATVVLLGQGASRDAPTVAPMPEGVPSGMPQAGQSGMPVPQGAQNGLPGGDVGDRGTKGTVIAVAANADGTASATIRLEETPADVTAQSGGVASIQVEVLASGVIVIPTAAITTGADSATVQVVAEGATESRDVVVGEQAGGRSEIVSGLTEGENVVWSRSFPTGGAAGNGQGQTDGAAQTEGGTQ